MDAFLKDARYGFRMLLKSPLFTGVAIAALALGIGTNTAIFSLFNAYVLRPLPFESPEQLVSVWQTNQRRGSDRDPVSYPNFEDVSGQSRSFAEAAAYTFQRFNLNVGEAEPAQVQGGRASAELFKLLGVGPQLGRTFLPEEDAPGGQRVAVIGDGLWQRQFGGRPGIVGEAVKLDGESYTVVGVMPAGFKFPVQSQVDLWAPLGQAANRDARGMRTLNVIARLEAGATVEGARAEVNTIARRLQQEYPATNAEWGLSVVSLHEDVTRRARPALLLLLGVVGFVLLIACANVANLLLARAVARQQEFAVRIALGAGRVRLIRQLLTESLLLSLVSGAAGLLLALWSLKFLLSRAPDMEGGQAVGLDGRVLLFTLLASVVAAAVFGLLPALQTTKPDLTGALKEGGRNSSGGVGGRFRLRDVLVVFEVALSLILLVGAGVMIKSFLNLQRVDPGFDARGVLVVPVSLPRAGYPSDAQRAAFVRQAVERVAALPGVKSAGATSFLPLSGEDRGNALSIEGRALPPGEKVYASTREVTPDYFRTMGIPVVKGRVFTPHDTADAPAVVVVNEAMARKYFPGEDPVGKRLSLSAGQTGPWFSIVGVVGDVRHAGLSVEPAAEVYGPHQQDPVGAVSIVARTQGEPGALAAAARNEIRALDAGLPLYGVKTMEQALADSLAPVRASMTLLSVFAAMALLLALMGIFAFISYAVTQRTQEIGIRMALGAPRRHVLGLVVGQGMRLVLFGILLGAVGAFFLTRLMEGLLYGVSPLDPATYAAVSLVLAAASLLAALVPARRAARLDPLIALRPR